MARVLVTGATGFLGGKLVCALQKEGNEVIATGRHTAKLAQLPLPASAKVAVDLSDPAGVKAQESRFQGVTAIVHCAALSSPWGKYDAFHSANVQTTDTVIALGNALGIERLVHISTPSVYFKFEDQIGTREDMPLPPPVNAYAATKAIAEDHVRASGLHATILRPRGIYGSGDTTLVPRLLRAAKTGAIPLLRGGTAQTDLTHVSDVISAIRRALSAPAPVNATLNISGGAALSIKNIIEEVCARSAVPLRWRALPFQPCLAAVRLGETFAKLWPGQTEPKATAYSLGMLAYSQVLDITKAKEVLGWAPQVCFQDGLEEAFSRQPRP